MLRTTALVCAVTCLAAGLTATASARTTRGAGACAGADVIPIDAASLAVADEALLCLVNYQRGLRGVAKLRRSGRLRSAAIGHSDDMIAMQYFSHVGSNGSSPRQRIARTGYLRRGGAFGETLAWGSGRYATATQIVGAFLESAQHRSTMLDRSFREVGIGLVLGAPEPDAGSAATATLDFGRR